MSVPSALFWILKPANHECWVSLTLKHQLLTGVIFPLVTPFSADDSIDRAAIAKLVRFAIDGGAGTLMPTALTGEGLLLTEEETLEVWDAVFEATAGKVPVLPAIVATTTKRAMRMARAAEKFGACAIMVAPVISELYAGRSESDVYGFHAAVAQTTDLSIALFNYPSFTGVDYTAPLVARLAQIENIGYIKESTGDSRRIHAMHRLVGERIQVICGAPHFALEAFALGCQAWITGIMNIAPRSAKQLMHAVLDDVDLVAARDIYYSRLLPLVDAMAQTNNPTGVIKAGLRARGIDVGVPRSPGSDLDEVQFKALVKLVREIEKAESARATLARPRL